MLSEEVDVIFCCAATFDGDHEYTDEGGDGEDGI